MCEEEWWGGGDVCRKNKMYGVRGVVMSFVEKEEGRSVLEDGYVNKVVGVFFSSRGRDTRLVRDGS